MLNFENELNPEAVASNEGTSVDTVEAAIAAYEAMGDTEMAMIKVDMLEKGAKILSDSISANDALVAKGYESEAGASPVVSGYEAVCVMLGVDGNAVAGFESDDGKKAEGLLKKIWDGIKKAAAVVWKAITDMFAKIKTFVSGLIGKGDTTGDVIEKAAEKADDKEKEVSEKDSELIAKDLAVLGLLDYEVVDSESISNMLGYQVEALKAVTDIDLVKGIDTLEREIKVLIASKDLKNDFEKVANKIKEPFETIVGKLPNVDNIKSAKVKKQIADKITKATKGAKDGETASTDIYTTGLTGSKLSVLLVTKYTKDGVDRIKATPLTLKLTDKELSEFIKSNKKMKTLKKSDLSALGKKYIDANKIVTNFNKIDVKKVSEKATSLLTDMEKVLERKFDKSLKDDTAMSPETYSNISKIIDNVKTYVNNVAPNVLKGASETAADITSSKVRGFIKKSLISKAEKTVKDL
jgi:hypothetical protein